MHLRTPTDTGHQAVQAVGAAAAPGALSLPFLSVIERHKQPAGAPATAAAARTAALTLKQQQPRCPPHQPPPPSSHPHTPGPTGCRPQHRQQATGMVLEPVRTGNTAPPVARSVCTPVSECAVGVCAAGHAREGRGVKKCRAAGRGRTVVGK